MFGPLDEMFDFNHDGQLNMGERVMEYQFLEEMSKNSSRYDEDNDRDDDDDDNDDF